VSQKLAERLDRLERQIRAFKELHANELQIILDELADINAELVAAERAAQPEGPVPADPAAASPKRAKWLAEQERKARPLSRRELLRGREEEG
jgi:hypothetical protein